LQTDPDKQSNNKQTPIRNQITNTTIGKIKGRGGADEGGEEKAAGWRDRGGADEGGEEKAAGWRGRGGADEGGEEKAAR